MVQILLNGCCGKMGQVIYDVINQFPELNIIAGVDKYPAECKFQTFTSLSNVNVAYDVLLDFSSPAALKGLLSFSEKTTKPLVICTTGFTPSDLALINEKSSIIPIFKSANMSYGINLINLLLKKITPLLYGSYDIEIVEKHHNQKIDAPSGTALAIADAINDTLSEPYTYRYDRSTTREKRPKKEIGIHAVRGGTIVGEHEILFAGNDEFITLKHQATSKDVFAVGAIKAAMFLAPKGPGLYNMEHLLS